MFFTACGGGGSSTPTPTPPPKTVSISISPATRDIDAGQSVTLTVFAQNTAIIWPAASAVAGHFDASGNTVTWTPPAVAGAYEFTVTAAADTSKQATARITVKPPVIVVSIGISPESGRIKAGQSVILTVTTQNTAITWPPPGTFTTSGNTATWTPPAVAGTYEFTVTAAADTSKQATALITVLEISDIGEIIDVNDIDPAVTGVTDTYISGMNKNGQMLVELYDDTGKRKAYLCDVNAGPPPLCNEIRPPDALPGDNINVYGLNDDGDVLGRYKNNVYFLKTGSGYTRLDGYPGAVYTGINNSRWLTGSYADSSDYYHGLLYDYDGDEYHPVDHDLADKTGCGSAVPCGTYLTGINNNDQAVGYYINADGVAHGFLYSAGSFTPIEHPETTPINPISVRTSGINDSGYVAGWFHGSDGYAEGFVKAGGRFIEIAHPDAADDREGTFVLGITDSSEVVGWFVDKGGKSRGFTLKNILSIP